MRLPRLRFTVRRMMVAVAVVAFLFGAEATRRRWESLASTYRTKAVSFEHRALVSRHSRDHEAVLENDPEQRKLKRIEDHYVALARKYQYAAHYPWLAVEPDPPEP
jgi:hypothetical protein